MAWLVRAQRAAVRGGGNQRAANSSRHQTALNTPRQSCTCHSARPSATASRCCHERMIHDLRGWPAGMLESSYSRLTPFSSRPGCRNLPDGWASNLQGYGSAAMLQSPPQQVDAL